MAESPEQPHRKPGPATGGYLPRVWKAEPEPEPSDTAPLKKKKKKPGADNTKGAKKGKKGKHDGDPDGEGPKGALLEETPELDTLEARRKVRLIAGLAAVCTLLLIGFILYRVIGGSTTSDDIGDVKIEITDMRLVKERNESEARTMVENVRDLARKGKTDLAISMLKRVATSYPETRAASETSEIVNRPRPDLAAFAKGIKPTPPDLSNPVPPEPGSPGRIRNVNTVASAPCAAGPQTVNTPGGPEPSIAASVPPVPIESRPGPPGTPGFGNATGPVVPEMPARPLPAGFQARSGVAVDASGWPKEIVGNRDGALMVLVPGVLFVMGHDGSEMSEAPAHQVRVSTFYIDKHEVTNRQFERYLKETGSRPERSRALVREGNSVNTSEDYPAVMVTAREARDYAEWAGKRLPTEAQWELAARGAQPDHRLYPWGPHPPEWERPRVPRQIDPVMSFPTDLSPFGAYDMAGNASEWTRDWYDPRFYQLFRNGTADDPTGPSNRPASMQLSVRGGSKQWTVTAREGFRVETRLPFLGFRCVLPIEGNMAQPAANDAAPRPAPGVVVPF